VVIARLGGIYGPLYGTMNHAIARMCYAAAHNRPAEFTGSRMGMPHADEERMYGYVKDVAWGVQLLCTTERLNHRVYNISSGVATSYREIAECVQRVVPIDIQMSPGKGRDPRPNPYMDISRAREDLGFAPQYDIQRGVAEYIDWLRTHPE
jgi:UDP-glucose 4-epimerase